MRKHIVRNLNNFRVRVDESFYKKEDELLKEVEEVKTRLLKEQDLISLSAPQLGIHSRFFCLKFANNEVVTFLNPMIIKREGITYSRETNASIPNKEFIVIRNNEIECAYQTMDGKIDSNLFKGASACAFQQMVDLLDGVMISDIGMELPKNWDSLSPLEQECTLSDFTQSLLEKQRELVNEIQNTPKLKEVSDAIKFMTSVNQGKITFEKDDKVKEEKLDDSKKKE